MLLSPGTQDRYISETTVGSGSTVKEGSILTDSILATLWVNSIGSGTLSVSIYTLTDVGKEALLFSFPVVSASTTNLLLKKAAISLQRFRIVATYTGICNYEVYVRAVEGAGESSSVIQGAGSLTSDQTSIGTTPTILIASILTDRQGLVVKNWSTTGNLFISESAGKLPGQGWPLAPKDAIALDVGAGTAIYGVSDAGTLDIRILQAGT